MSRARGRTISIRLNDAERSVLQAVAAPETIGGWARQVLFNEAFVARPTNADAILAEIAALRTIVVNISYALATGEPLSADGTQRLLARADEEKRALAKERVASLTLPRSAHIPLQPPDDKF